jgi:hypothetical protein
MKSTIRTIALVATFLIPSLALAQYGYGQSIGGVGNTIIYLINNVFVPILFAIAFIVFLYGVAKTYIFSHGEPAEVSEGHKLILWGILGFAVMVSLWGLVNVVANTFQLSGVGAPQLPTSY